MSKIRITSGEYVFTGELLEKEAPQTCRVFREMLPIKSKFIHVRWSGEGIWIPYGEMRTGIGYENHTSHPAKGEFLFYPGGISEMEMMMSYGRCCFASQYGQLAGNHFMTVTGGLERLGEFGQKVLWEGGQDVTIEMV